MSFWMAFILADNSRLKKKISWCLTGLAAIWFINCLRVAIILMAFEKDWKALTNLDQHTLFNVVAYLLIFFMIFLYHRSDKKEQENTQPV
jgi:exosortase/archaeosortase family protein